MTIKRQVGDFGEEITAEYLERNGYRILGRNYSKPFGEIDIIATKDDLISFVEVKTRKSDAFAYAAEAVDFYKQQRIKRASQAYLVENNMTDFLMSFDIAEVYLDTRKINYIENAF
ncbi:YraN family protein [uncultured Anaerococcus sp.]|uniref:YraN family protein n=1 Tax=uncultured Anaerococcus sp. TaxID=293428 RepID=UPI00288BE831|nr:YraN family protein [uncultured Anaerococcus sp.]